MQHIDPPGRVAAGHGDALEGALLTTLLARSAAELVVLDDALRVLWSHGAYGATPRHRIGDRFGEGFLLDDPPAFEALLSEARAGPEPRLLRTKGRRTAEEGPSRSLLLTAQRLEGPEGGAPLGVLVAVDDVTEGERDSRRAAAVAAVRDSVGRTMDATATARELAECLVPDYAGIAAVDLVIDVLHGEEPPSAAEVEGRPLRRAAMSSAVPLPAHASVDVRYLPPRTPFGRALADAHPRLVDLESEVVWLDADPQWNRAVRLAGAHSLLIAPLTLHGTVLGMLTLYRCGGDEPFCAADLDAAAILAARAALTMDNARRYQHDHTIAATVQRRLLPQPARAQVALDTAHAHRVGPDTSCWYDSIALPGARTALVVGAVAGGSIQAAAVMGQLRLVVRALAELDLPPDELLARLHESAARLAKERAALPPGDPLHREPLTAACVYTVYDPSTRQFATACAGGAPPLIVSPEGRVWAPEVAPGPALGSPDLGPLAKSVVTVAEGSVLALRAGGFVRDTESADAQLRSALARPEFRLPELCDAMVYALPDEALEEGAVLLLARTGALPRDHVVTVELGYERTSPAEARGIVREQCATWGIDEDTARGTELLASELVTNAVRYGAPPVRMRLVLSDVLTCEVYDDGAAAPQLRHPRTMDEGGRGLYLVAQFAARWGVRPTGTGKVLWAEQALHDGE
ncbi:ATP-binding SpoIIE family protein phosphatase [Streptomyces griseicoloratus]|uniref:ATP-binding SpoIIE family protein phosphatase n=1 Tax=Streptomyces griseicoloratus TaxID=2752516 RepID=UPI002810D3B1|nr:serine/threonine-protein phosphatase [Streptomyces griseicoloratus]